MDSSKCSAAIALLVFALAVTAESIKGVSDPFQDLRRDLRKCRHRMANQTRELVASQRRVEELEEMLLKLTVENQRCNTSNVFECPELEHQQQINELVKQFRRSDDWKELREGLEAALDHEDTAYAQLQQVDLDTSMPLWKVGYHDLRELAELLVCGGLPARSQDGDGDTMLHGAAAGGHLVLVQLLVERGADLEASNKWGWTPMTRALRGNHTDVVQWLLNAGAGPAATDPPAA